MVFFGCENGRSLDDCTVCKSRQEIRVIKQLKLDEICLIFISDIYVAIQTCIGIIYFNFRPSLDVFLIN